MIKEVLKKFTKKFALVLCVSAMSIGGAAVSAQAAESSGVQESDAGQAELSGMNADYLNFGQVESRQIEEYGSVTYELKVSKAGKVVMNFESYNTEFYLTWYDENGDDMFIWWMNYNSSLGFAKDCQSVYLMPGTYYVMVTNRSDEGSYKMKASFEDPATNEKEPNNGYKSAMPIKLNSVVVALITYNDKADFFKFRVSEKSKVIMKVASSEFSNLDWEVYNQDGDEIAGERLYADDSGVIKTTLSYNLEAGVYYIKAYSFDTSVTGAYAFKVSSPITLGSKNVSLSKTKYEYDGKVKSPAVIVKDNSGKRLVKGRDYTVYAQSGRRNVGIYKVKVVFKGNYKGSTVKTFTIIPARTTITGIANKSNGIKIAWKQRKAANATGYIVYRSVNGGAYKAIKVIRSTRTTAFTDTGANSWWDTYSYKVIVYKNLGGKTYKSPASNGKSVYRY